MKTSGFQTFLLTTDAERRGILLNKSVIDFKSAAADNGTFKKIFYGLFEEGIYIEPNVCVSWLLNDALNYDDLDIAIAVVGKVGKTL